MSHYAGIRGGLFEEKHRRAMGPAVWLFGWLVDRQTSQRDGRGLVLYGQPLRLERIAAETGFPL
ncbi:MAG: hypothetical protein ACE5HB_10150, partial [Terriglobia bacterium]